MSYLFSFNAPLQSILWPAQGQQKALRELLLIILGTVVLALSSQISIPLEPVPLTFQSATVILIGMVYGTRMGAGVVLAYLAAGACGVPVFAEMKAGLPVFFGPTGGYLLGFVPAVMLTGYLSRRGWAGGVITSFMAACLGAAVIFFSGVIVLAQYTGLHDAILLGVKPFLLTETAKLFFVALLVPKLWKKG